MTIKGIVENKIGYLSRLTAKYGNNELHEQRAVEIVISALLQGPDGLKGIQYPVAYVQFLRSCFEPIRHVVESVKEDTSAPDNSSNRFHTLIEMLEGGLPEVEFSLAQEIGLIVDQERANPKEFIFNQWTGDVGLHLSISSSFGNKGRILVNIIRFMRAQNCLEVGMAYGISGLFILGALKSFSKGGHLTTIELMEPQFTIGSTILKREHSDAVSCHFGHTEKLLPEVTRAAGTIDFMFHDGGHSREDYIRDFNMVVDSLAPGAVVLFDDIRWVAPPNLFEGDPRTYEGWKAVIAHPRVRRAVEVDSQFGLFQVR
jgi:predicted O-methyltransferase YrrM